MNLENWLVPATTVCWDEHRSFGTMSLGHERITQTWEKDGDTWRITESDRDGRVRESHSLRIAEVGAMILGIWKDDVLVPWDPPLVWLPPSPAAGQTWTSVHRRPDGTQVVREVEITASEHHPDVLTVVTDLRSGADDDPGRYRLVIRDHFRAGTGWIGYEALLSRPTGAMRTWSDRVERDGVALAEPEDT